MSPVIVFRLNTLKGTAEAPAEELLRLNILRGIKAPERNDEHPCRLHMTVPPRGHLLIGQLVGQEASLSFSRSVSPLDSQSKKNDIDKR